MSDDLFLVIIGGLIAFGASVIGAIIGAYCGANYDAKVKWNNRPRLIILQSSLCINQDKKINKFLIKNIGKTTAYKCLIEAVISDEANFKTSRTLYDADFENGTELLYPTQTREIPWLFYDCKVGYINFNMNTITNESTNYHRNIDSFIFPVTCGLHIYAIDTEPVYFEYKIYNEDGKLIVK